MGTNKYNIVNCKRKKLGKIVWVGFQLPDAWALSTGTFPEVGAFVLNFLVNHGTAKKNSFIILFFSYGFFAAVTGSKTKFYQNN